MRDTNHPSQSEYGIVLEQGLAEDAEEGDHPGHQEPGGDGDQDENEGDELEEETFSWFVALQALRRMTCRTDSPERTERIVLL